MRHANPKVLTGARSMESSIYYPSLKGLSEQVDCPMTTNLQARAAVAPRHTPRGRPTGSARRLCRLCRASGPCRLLLLQTAAVPVVYLTRSSIAKWGAAPVAWSNASEVSAAEWAPTLLLPTAV